MWSTEPVIVRILYHHHSLLVSELIYVFQWVSNSANLVSPPRAACLQISFMYFDELVIMQILFHHHSLLISRISLYILLSQ